MQPEIVTALEMRNASAEPSSPDQVGAALELGDAHSELPPIPRHAGHDHNAVIVEERLKLCERVAHISLPHIAGKRTAFEDVRHNIENLVGFVQVPMGIAGPLCVDTSNGLHNVYVPMATTEGALVASYSRGMRMITAAGGARARVLSVGLGLHPMLVYESAARAAEAALEATRHAAYFQALTGEFTKHGRLLRVEPACLGRRLVLRLVFDPGDAIGINMACLVGDQIASVLARLTGALQYYVHGQVLEKRANARSSIEGRGRTTMAEVVIPRGLLQKTMRVDPEAMRDVLESQVHGYLHSGSQQTTIQSANGLCAVMLACGQDVAYLPECASGLLDLSVTPLGDLHACVMLPALLVGTVGGGTAQGTAAECLALLGCRGTGCANRFAEILTATVLAGDLSLLAALCTHEFVSAHERHGRNRPAQGSHP
jgi:hydroxymethylglutaryl-CoA reductase (NADPH)